MCWLLVSGLAFVYPFFLQSNCLVLYTTAISAGKVAPKLLLLSKHNWPTVFLFRLRCRFGIDISNIFLTKCSNHRSHRISLCKYSIQISISIVCACTVFGARQVFGFQRDTFRCYLITEINKKEKFLESR